MPAEYFHQERREEGGNDDDEADIGQHIARHQPAVDARLRADQHDFRTHHHAAADLGGVARRVAAQKAARAAADEFTRQSGKDIARAERQPNAAERAEIDVADADICKEDGGEDHIAEIVDLLLLVVRFLQTAEQQPRDICPRDLRHAEEFFGRVGIGKPECHGENGHSSVVRIFFSQPIEELAHEQSEAHGGDEKYDDLDADHDGSGFEPRSDRAGRAAARRTVQPRHDGEDDDADDVVDDRGGHDGGAEGGVEFSELFEGRHGDGYRSRRQDGAVERVGKKIHLSDRSAFAAADEVDGGEVVEEKSDQESEQHGHHDAQRCDDDRRNARRLDLFQVGAHARRKHDEHHADLRQELIALLDGIAEKHIVEEVAFGDAGDVLQQADEYAGDEHADDGGHADFLRTQAQ